MKSKDEQRQKDKTMSSNIDKMNKTNYKKYLNTKHWKDFRKEIKKQRNTCEICGRNTSLHLHHLSYDNLGAENENDVIILCQPCHKKTHYTKEGKKVGFVKTSQRIKQFQKNVLDKRIKQKEKKKKQWNINKAKKELATPCSIKYSKNKRFY